MGTAHSLWWMATCGLRCSTELDAIRERIELANKLLLQAQHLRMGRNVGGVQRVERKIKAEKSFLDSILSGRTALKDTHLSSTNLTHLQSVLQIAQEIEGLVAIQQCFTLVPGLGRTPVSVQVDVVGEGGGRWVRVFCRKRSALHRRWLGDGQFGEKSASDVAGEYMEAGKQNLHKFCSPRISFVFFDGITESVAGILHGSGIEVLGPVYPDCSTDEAPSVEHVMSMMRERWKDHLAGSESRKLTEAPVAGVDLHGDECERVNLDISTMLAWVSSLTHGGAAFILSERMLNEQAEDERKSPLWPQLQRITRGKKLLACRTAADGFSSIVEKVGGEQEKIRARSLLDALHVVEDCPSPQAMALVSSHRITHRAKIIFGSGDALRVTTLTANGGFVRAAAHQGVHFDVWIHPSRALTESKQLLYKT